MGMIGTIVANDVLPMTNMGCSSNTLTLLASIERIIRCMNEKQKICWI